MTDFHYCNTKGEVLQDGLVAFFQSVTINWGLEVLVSWKQSCLLYSKSSFMKQANLVHKFNFWTIPHSNLSGVTSEDLKCQNRSSWSDDLYLNLVSYLVYLFFFFFFFSFMLLHLVFCQAQIDEKRPRLILGPCTACWKKRTGFNTCTCYLTLSYFHFFNALFIFAVAYKFSHEMVNKMI